MTSHRLPMIVIVVALVAAACSSSHIDRAPSSSSTAPATSPRTPEAAAITLARRMLDGVVLPVGARPSVAPLPPLLRDSFPIRNPSHNAEVHRLWAVDGDPNTAMWFLASHVPAGFVGRDDAGGVTDTKRGLRSWFLRQDLRVLPANTNRAGVSIGVEAEAGKVVLAVEASVIWSDVRPADTLASERDRVVIVTIVRDEPGTHVVRRVVVTDRRRVTEIVRSFDALPERERGPTSCSGPLLGIVYLRYRVAFATAQTATPDREVLVTGICGGGIMVGGSHYYLDDPNAAFVPALGRALGQPRYLSFVG